MRGCKIEAVSAMSSAGNSLDALYRKILSGETALKQTQRGDISSFFGAVENLPPLPNHWPTTHRSRNNQLLWALFLQIEAQYRELSKSIDPARIGIAIGTSTSGVGESEPYFDYLTSGQPIDHGFHLDQQDISSPSDSLSRVLGVDGPAISISTACSSGANALASAKRWLEQDICDIVIAGGVDTLCQLTISGFHSLSAMSDQLTIPMSKNRAGINLGEGGALFLLSAHQDGCQVAGVGGASDAHHFSAPHPDGRGAQAAMLSALRQAQVRTDEVGYLNLHGTGTEQNDAMESKAVSSVFGKVPCSSTKGIIGHTLGAAGALEVAICYAVLLDSSGRAPANAFDGVLDPSLPLIGLLTESEATAARVAMSNSFAFGGSNVSVVLKSGVPALS
ncbi:MAG: beta-ketoacyl-ACP synthase [Gammaproteobacteria bacterium]|nr:beta-ketoacyl-ACP synthase [Gammaproteobacteria bacterium]